MPVGLMPDDAAPFLALARIAPSLSHVAVRVLLQLLADARPRGDLWVAAVSRKLAPRIGVGRSTMVAALDELVRAGHLSTRTEVAAGSSWYRLDFVELYETVVQKLDHPPSAEGELYETVVQKLDPMVQKLDHPPSAKVENQGELYETVVQKLDPMVQKLDHPPGASLDLSKVEDLDQIDLFLKAKVADCETSALIALRSAIESYAANPVLCAERPEKRLQDSLLAQILAIAPLPRLLCEIDHLRAERKQLGWSYGWFFTVLLERLRGVSPEALKAHRHRLRESRKPARPETRDREFGLALVDQLKRAKGMGQ